MQVFSISAYHSNTTIHGILVTLNDQIEFEQAFAGSMTDGNLRQTCKSLVSGSIPSSDSLTEHSRARG